MSTTASARDLRSGRSRNDSSIWSNYAWLAVLLIAGLAVYSNSFSGAWVYDDVPAIVENPTIRHLSSITDVLSPPRSGLPVSGRPMVNLSLALNYAVGGLDPWTYHAVNLAIHIAAALLLFGIIRRTWLRWQMLDAKRAPSREENDRAARVAGGVALLWLIHPLQTESVTYVVQRAESLMGFFFLATFYGFIRAAEIIEASAEARGAMAAALRRRASGWGALSVVACGLGMATKEVMVSAPLLVLLYDRTFFAGSLRGGWRRRWRYYVPLAGTWLVLAYLITDTGNRGGTAGFGSVPVWWRYALEQLPAIMGYLRLSLWPRPLIFDYGVEATHTIAELVTATLLLTALIAGTVWAWWRKPALGFLGLCFFAWLAPSSSVVPVATEIMAEHRMYLPLAVVLLLLVIGLESWLGRRSFVVILVLAVGSGVMTAQRNRDYCTERVLWADTVAKRPSNARAHFNLGTQFFADGEISKAIAQYRTAITIRPELASAHCNLANALLAQGDVTEAGQHAQRAVELNPALPEAQSALGSVQFKTGRLPEAAASFSTAIKLRPGDPDLHRNLGSTWSQLGRLDDAIAEYRVSLSLQPGSALTHFYLGNTLSRQGRLADAAAEYDQALQHQPNYPAARDNRQRVETMLHAAERAP